MTVHSFSTQYNTEQFLDVCFQKLGKMTSRVSYMMGRSDTVICPLTRQCRQLVRPRHAVVARRLGRWSRRLSMVLNEQRQLNDRAEIVVAVDA